MGHDSINKIRQTAEEARQLFFKHITGHITQIEVKLDKFTKRLRQSREENDFYETDLRLWNKQLSRLTEELAKPSNINLQQDSTPLLTKISVHVSSMPIYAPDINIHARWMQNGVTVAGGEDPRSELNQLSSAWGVYVDDDQSVYVADLSNHCIVEWKCGASSGQIVAVETEEEIQLIN